MSLSAGQKLGPYEITARLGAGGMGEVYRAHDRRLGRDVAIKILPHQVAADPARRARFDLEAKACGALNHPNIVTVYDTGHEEDLTYIVSELVEGESLRALVGKTTPRKLAAIGAQIAQGLAAAHAAGLTHRDLKPENIMIARDGRVKILDFGLAKASGASTPDETQTYDLAKTEPGAVLGTVAYMSPEQARGQEVDARSDIFSLGVVLYELAAGRGPFTGPSMADILSAILTADPPPLEGLPDSLARIIYRCLEKAPGARFQSAADLAFALEAASAGSTVTSATATVRPGGKQRTVSRRAALTAGGVIAAGAAGFVIGRFQRGSAVRELNFRHIATAGERIVSALPHPDGKSVIYHSRVDGQLAIFYQTLEGGAPRRLALPEGALAQSISVRGELAFTVGSMLYRSPIDPIAPRALLDDCFGANWSSDGESLQVVRHSGKKYRLEFPVGNTIFEHERLPADPCLAPRSGRSAFGVLDPEPRVLAVDRSGRVEVLYRGTGAFMRTAGFVWSPDEREVWGIRVDGRDSNALVAYAHGRQRLVSRLPGAITICGIAGSAGALIMLSWNDGNVSVMPPGAGKETIIDLSAQPQGFTAGGRALVLRLPHQPYYESDVYLQQFDGSPPVMLAKGNVDGTRWLSISPDGQWVQVSRQSPPLVVVPTGAGQEREITFPGVNVATIMGVAGSKWLLRGNIEGRGVSAHGYYLADPDTRQVEKLKFEETGDKTALMLSPDRTRLVFRESGGAARWNVAALDGGSAAVALNTQRGELIYGWTADSQSVYVGKPGGAEFQIDCMEVKGSRRTPWKTFHSGRPDVLLANLAVTPDGAAWAYARSHGYDRLVLAQGLA